MGFDNHIFISYAHVDNMPLDSTEGWVSTFHQDLCGLLHQFWGQEPKIWRDLKLQGNDYFTDEIVQQVSTVALLVSVLSPRYVQSEWCIRELKSFCEATKKNGGIRFGNKGRIFKVIKTPIDPQMQPEELQDFLGYEFFDRDAQGNINCFDRMFGETPRQQYWKKLSNLAYDIKQLLETPSSPVTPSNFPAALSATSETYIYLAESTYALREEKDNIRRELEQRGYIVLPKQELPSYYPDAEKLVKESLQPCKLSIHVIGKSYGRIPEAADRSLVQLQYELALQHRRENPQFTALSWMPSGIQIEESRQQQFLEWLQNDPEFSQSGIEEFKSQIQDRLNPPRFQISIPVEAQFKRIYLIYDRSDVDEAFQIQEHIYNQGFEPILSLLDGEEKEIREYHCDQLRICDAVILYYSDKTNWNWLQIKLSDLRKVPGYGRSKPLLHKAVFIAASCTEEHRRRLRTREAELIESLDRLTEFAAKVR
jgi:hypothetical protein